MTKPQPSLCPKLVRFYLNRHMPERLAEAALVCQYLETLLADLPATQTGRIAPVFDYPQETLRQDWLRCRWFDLWLDGTTGEIAQSLPPTDGEPDLHHHHLPEETQRQILFGRWAHLFR